MVTALVFSCLQALLHQLLGVGLLGVTSEVVFAPKSLGAELTQEVLASCVDHQVATHILPGVEASLAVGALVFLLPGRVVGLVFRVRLEVVQQDLGAPQLQGADAAGEIAAAGRMQGHVPLVAQHGVVFLATIFAGVDHLVGIVGLEVILQVILSVESLRTLSTLVNLLGRVRSHVSHQLILGDEGFATLSLGALEWALPGVGIIVDGELLQGEEGLAAFLTAKRSHGLCFSHFLLQRC